MTRIERLKEFLKEKDLDGLLVTNRLNLRYLTNFSGTNGTLLLNKERAIFITDFRYLEQARLELKDEFEIVMEVDSFTKTLKPLLSGVKRLGVEADHLTFLQFKELKEGLKISIIPISGQILSLRKIKEEEEIERIRQAINLASSAWEVVFRLLKPGLAEIEIAIELECHLRRSGTDGFGFPSIVTSGLRSALPHGRPTKRRLEDGDFIVIDWGAVYEGYHCDLTRTLVIGQPNEEQKRIYRTVLEAQELGLSLIRPGFIASELDRRVREFISDQGFGEFFGHNLGHGVGLDVHEEPVISKKNNEPLVQGMVFTIEPGIYIPGIGGARIEDMILVTEDGCEVLSKDLPKWRSNG